MIDDAQSIYYASYALICAALVITYIKIKSSEGITITTKEFKIFQSGFLTGYSLMILSELISTATFYYTFVSLKLSLEQVTKLYVVTIVSTTACGVLTEIIDVGSRKNKCVLSGILYCVAMSTIFIGGHYDLVLLGRIIYGAASALHHSSFESYVIHEHTSLGFPDDWLTQTFTFLTHAMAVVAVVSGTFGQMVAAMAGPLGCAGLCAALFGCTAVYIALAWTKDMGGPKFMLSGFLFNVNQTIQATKSNKQMILLLAISSLCESTITIFTFYWAPWITSMVVEEAHTVPYSIVFATYIAASMLGNYIYQMYSPQIGIDSIFQGILVASSAAYFLGAAFQTPAMAFGISVVVQMCVGGYWPSVGFLRGRYVLPELRATFLTISRYA
jgi:hypothetical protein